MRATSADAPELLVLQRCCWVDEAVANDTLMFRPSTSPSTTYVCGSTPGRRGAFASADVSCGAVRARPEGSSWEIGRLMVAPDLAGRGLGGWRLRLAEAHAPADIESIAPFTGARSDRNIAMYERAGFRRTLAPAPSNAVRLVKYPRA